VKQEMHTQFSWGNFLKRETLEMNRTDNKMHPRNTGDKHVNLIKLAHYFINDSKVSVILMQLFTLERFFTNDHIQKEKLTVSPDTIRFFTPSSNSTHFAVCLKI
jgi:hypothetical protein